MADATDLSDLREAASRYDRSDMAGVIERTGAQVAFALSDTDFPELPSRTVEEVIVVGMGGSALPVDILNDVLEDRLPRPIGVCRHYRVPRPTTDGRLLIFSSFSGNTEEVVEPLRALPESARDVAIVTAGGELSRIGEERSIPTVMIPAHREPAGFQPRSASGYIVTYLARLIDAAGFSDVAFEPFVQLADFLGSLELRDEGERIARALEGRVPIFYTDETHHLSVARIAKIKYNENAKRPAFFNALPEANHNEMIGLSGAAEDFSVVYFRDPSSHPRVHRRYEVLGSVLAGPHMTFLEWEMSGSNRLERVFSALTLADWISYYGALLRGVDPTPVELVERFKGLLTDA